MPAASLTSQILVAELLGVDHGVFNLGTDLSDFFSPIGRRLTACRFELVERGRPLLQFLVQLVGLQIVGLGRLGHRLLPTVVTRQVAAVPLGADVVQFAQSALADQIDRVIVENVVVSLVAGGQQQLGLFGHASHFLALMDAMAHQLFGDDVQAVHVQIV